MADHWCCCWSCDDVCCNVGKAQDQRDLCCFLPQDQHAVVCCHLQQGQHAHVNKQGPDISNLDLGLQQQWDHVANAHLGNIIIKPHSHKIVLWTCNQCPDGHLHRWSARVGDRTRGNGCPQCIGQKVCKHNSLATKAPVVAAQWDYKANDGTPDDVVANSNQLANWHCRVCGCKWEATPELAKRKLAAHSAVPMPRPRPRG